MEEDISAKDDVDIYSGLIGEKASDPLRQSRNLQIKKSCSVGKSNPSKTLFKCLKKEENVFNIVASRQMLETQIWKTQMALYDEIIAAEVKEREEKEKRAIKFEELLEKVKLLNEEIVKKDKEIVELAMKNENLTKNICSLYKTAQDEIERKDFLLLDANRELDTVKSRIKRLEKSIIFNEVHNEPDYHKYQRRNIDGNDDEHDRNKQKEKSESHSSSKRKDGDNRNKIKEKVEDYEKKDDSDRRKGKDDEPDRSKRKEKDHKHDRNRSKEKDYEFNRNKVKGYEYGRSRRKCFSSRIDDRRRLSYRRTISAKSPLKNPRFNRNRSVRHNEKERSSSSDSCYHKITDNLKKLNASHSAKEKEFKNRKVEKSSEIVCDTMKANKVDNSKCPVTSSSVNTDTECLSKDDASIKNSLPADVNNLKPAHEQSSSKMLYSNDRASTINNALCEFDNNQNLYVEEIRSPENNRFDLYDDGTTTNALFFMLLPSELRKCFMKYESSQIAILQKFKLALSGNLKEMLFNYEQSKIVVMNQLKQAFINYFFSHRDDFEMSSINPPDSVETKVQKKDTNSSLFFFEHVPNLPNYGLDVIDGEETEQNESMDVGKAILEKELTVGEIEATKSLAVNEIKATKFKLTVDETERTKPLAIDEVETTKSLAINEVKKTKSVVMDGVKATNNLVKDDNERTKSLAINEIKPNKSLGIDGIEETEFIAMDEVETTESLGIDKREIGKSLALGNTEENTDKPISVNIAVINDMLFNSLTSVNKKLNVPCIENKVLDNDLVAAQELITKRSLEAALTILQVGPGAAMPAINIINTENIFPADNKIEQTFLNEEIETKLIQSGDINIKPTDKISAEEPEIQIRSTPMDVENSVDSVIPSTSQPKSKKSKIPPMKKKLKKESMKGIMKKISKKAPKEGYHPKFSSVYFRRQLLKFALEEKESEEGLSTNTKEDVANLYKYRSDKIPHIIKTKSDSDI